MNTQNNQVTEPSNIKLPFNAELPSSLSVERINQLNYLAYDAEVRYGERSGNKVDEGSMMIECFGLIEALDIATDFDSSRYFHNNINRAFSHLVTECPNDRESIFDTYADLQQLFRVLLKQRKYLEAKLQECNAIVSDFNTLDNEVIANLKGGVIC